MRKYLPKLMDGVTSFDGAVIRGRVNVNLAPREVLRAIPGLDRERWSRLSRRVETATLWRTPIGGMPRGF